MALKRQASVKSNRKGMSFESNVMETFSHHCEVKELMEYIGWYYTMGSWADHPAEKPTTALPVSRGTKSFLTWWGGECLSEFKV